VRSGGHNCVPNEDRVDFPPVLESGHSIAVVQGSPPNVGHAAHLRLQTR
jgi:hypothetical protein